MCSVCHVETDLKQNYLIFVRFLFFKRESKRHITGSCAFYKHCCFDEKKNKSRRLEFLTKTVK